MQYHKIYTIYDKKAKLYTQPMFLANDMVAIRQYMTLVNDKQTIVGQFPTDFSLRCVGNFNYTTGHITPCEPIDINLEEDNTHEE